MRRPMEWRRALGIACFGLAGLALVLLVASSAAACRRHFIMFGEGGMGTFPGGQSTGGYSEFDFEQPVKYDGITATESQRLSRLGPNAWKVVSGPCKGMSSVGELKACVAGRLKKPAGSREGRAAVKERERIKYALNKPGTANVGVNDRSPSLEDVIKANKVKDMSSSYATMKRLQKVMDDIVNQRNFDTEDLTSHSSAQWRKITYRMCCKDMYDNVCNQPCVT